MSLINCKNISLCYDNCTVVSELSFEIESGDYLCIIGENGSGKSTLIKSLLGLKKPFKGSIEINDELKRNEFGYLPQQSSLQRDFPASVYEVVLSGFLNSRKLKPFYSKKNKEDALKNIELLGISNLTKKCYRELSGGQQQRVLLARALSATKKILLLDEPVAGLDPMVTNELYSLIKSINKELGITIIMVSHDIRSAVENANKILHMHEKNYFFGKTMDYLNSPLGKIFLGGIQHD